MFYFTTSLNYSESKRPNIFERVQDGEDAVSVYGFWEQLFQSEEIKHEEVLMADVLVRKTLVNTTFIMFLENVTYVNKNDEKNDFDSKDLDLPIVLTMNTDFELDHIMVSNNDSERSLKLKNAVIDSLFGDTTKITLDWVKCTMPFLFENTKDFKKQTTNATQSGCDGPRSLNGTFPNASPFSQRSLPSSQNRTYSDKFGNELSSEVFLSIKEADNSTNAYSIGKNFFFKEMKASVKEINESDFTVSI